MLLICLMAMSTIGSSFALTNSQQTAENIVNPALVDQNTVNSQNSTETVKSSTTETQNPVQSTESTTQTESTTINNNTQTTDDTTTNKQENTQNSAPTADVNNQNSVNTSSTNTVNSNIQSTVNTQEEPQAAAGDNYTNINGIWLKAEDAGNITVSELKNANITDIFVKTNLISAPTYQTVLGSIINKIPEFRNTNPRMDYML